MATANTTAARQALDLLRNQMTGDDLRQLSDSERSQFAAICDHWAQLATYRPETHQNATPANNERRIAA